MDKKVINKHFLLKFYQILHVKVELHKSEKRKTSSFIFEYQSKWKIVQRNLIRFANKYKMCFQRSSIFMYQKIEVKLVKHKNCETEDSKRPKACILIEMDQKLQILSSYIQVRSNKSTCSISSSHISEKIHAMCRKKSLLINDN